MITVESTKESIQNSDVLLNCVDYFVKQNLS